MQRSTHIDWSTASFFEQAAGGKGYVGFVEFPEHNTAVVKWSDEPAGELVSYRIGKLLSVAMPTVVVLNSQYGEGREMEASFHHLRICGKVKEVSKGSGGASIRSSTFRVIQEFQRGKNLRDIAHEPGTTWASILFPSFFLWVNNCVGLTGRPLWDELRASKQKASCCLI